jgi:acid phosphatase
MNGRAAFFAFLLATTPAAAQVWTPDHVVIVMEENHAYSQIIGSGSAPYINGLLSQGASLTNSFAVTHPSQPNYLALFSGSTQGVIDDTTPSTLPFSTANLGAQLIAAGKTFTGYSEALPSVGFTGDNAGGSSGYYRKHNPWVNWQQTSSGQPNTMPTTVNQPFTSFPSDYSTLPTVSFVVPTQLNDMHDGTIAQGDTWLSNNLNGYVQWAKTHNSLFVMVFDEDDDTHGNQIPEILVGQRIIAGATSAQLVNHYNMLATIQDMYGLSRTGSSVGVSGLTGIFTPVPEPSTFLLVTAAAIPAALRRRRFLTAGCS